MEELTEKDFDTKISNTELALVDFWASWCGPCRMMAPVLSELEAERNIKVFKVNVDKEVGLAKQFNILAIPTMIVFKNGDKTDKIIGTISLRALEKKIFGEF